MPSTQPKSKYWVFTVNNPTPEEEKSLTATVVAAGSKITYLVFGRERGDSGTPHLQGYLELRNRVRLPSVKSLPGLGRAHLERRRGSADEADAYCRKEDPAPFSVGVISKGQGHRSDLEQIKSKIDEGKSQLEIADQHFTQWVQYRRSFEAYRELKHPPKDRFDLRVYVLWGDAGTGKTRYARRRGGDDCWVCSDPTLRWFDGYSQESTVIIDDYRGDGSPAFLLRLLDVYALRVQVKGGFVAWNPTTIWITSNRNPDSWHMEPDFLPALRRRFHYVMRFRNLLDFDDADELARFDDLMR